MVKQIWRRELHLQLLRLEHQKADDFLLCQWQTARQVKLGYVLYRWMLACFFVVTLICSLCSVSRDPGCYAKWLVYLTNWGYMVNTSQAIISSCFLTSKLVSGAGGDTSQETMKPVYKLYWALHTTGVVVAYGITLTYWVTIYDPKVHHLDAVNILGHAVNSVVMTVDLFVVRHPVHLLHAYLPLSFTLAFFLFSVAYHLAGGTSRHGDPYIYPMLDWGRPWRTLLCCALGLVFVFGVHVSVWALYLLRGWLHGRLPRGRAPPQHRAVPSASSAL